LLKKAICHSFTLLLFVLPVKAQTYIFAQLQGTPLNTAGWNLQGAAKVTNVTGTGNTELLLCPAINNQSGAAFVNQPINLGLCNKWEADFDFRMFDGTAADGIAFCFLDVPPVGFVLGGGMGIPSTANGLKVCFDTWDNCTPNTPAFNMPKVELRWGNGYTECSNLPTAANVNGQLSFIRSNSYVHAQITYDNGNIAVTLNNIKIITGYQQFTFTGYLGFTSSTGGSNDNQSIKNVTIYTQMPPSVAGQVSSPICPNNTVQLGTAGDTAYRYSWTPATGLSNISISNPTATVNNTTGNVLYQKYYVKTSYSANAGCASTDSVTITVNPKPLTDFSAPVVCLPQGNTVITNKTVINDGTQSQIAYNWKFSDGGTSTQTNPAHNYPVAGNYSINLLATSSNGCKDSVSKSFTVNPKAKTTISAPSEFCQDTALAFNGSSTAPNIQKWYWDFGDNSVDSTQNPSHKYNTVATFIVKLYAITGEGCISDTASASVLIDPLPVAAFSFSGLNCEKQLIQFKDNSQPSVGTISSRNWLFDDGTQAATPIVDHSFSAYGTHTVTLSVQNSKGCNSSPVSQNIVINAKPVAIFGAPFVCKGVSGTFIDSSTIADNTQSQLTYNWAFGDGASSTAQQPSHAYTNAGNYQVQLIVMSNNGCPDTSSANIAISDYPVVNFSILTTNFCGNLPLQLQNNSSVNYAVIDQLRIFWDSPASPDSTLINNPVAGSVYTHNYPTFGNINSKQVTVKLVAYSSAGCFTEDTSTSILFASPKLVFDSIPTYCSNTNQNILLNEAKDTTVFSGNGVYSGDGVTGGAYFNPASAGAGLHTITYNYTLINGCSDTVTQTVTVGPQPTVSAGQTEVILNGGQIVLQGAASGGNNLSYIWTPDLYLDSNTILQPLAMPKTDTYYSLTATNDNGCSNSAGVLIKVLQYPAIPNAFSPNGDGINDSWQIAYLSSYPDCIVEVFNRYGQIVFHSTGYSTPWNGTYNGKMLPIGTYYYIITTTHLPRPLNGSVTILR